MEKKPRKKYAKHAFTHRKCKVCGQKFVVLATDEISPLDQHFEEHHPDYFISGRGKLMKKMYFNPINNQWYGSLPHLTRSIHALGWTREQYYVQYGKEYLPDIWAKNEYDEKYGNARNVPFCLETGVPVKFDDWSWSYPVFKSESESTKWHAKNTDRVQKAKDTFAEKRRIDPNHGLTPTSLQYWLNKGYTLEEAKAKVRERQATVSKKRYIERAGGDVAEGTKRWLERNAKWSVSFNKSTCKGNRSKKADAMFAEIAKHVPDILYGENEQVITLREMVVRPDCVFGNKIIEFFGNYPHAHPHHYQDDHVIRRHDENGVSVEKTAKMIRERDAKRLSQLEDAGYRVMIVWELDYDADKANTVQSCVDFLTNRE